MTELGQIDQSQKQSRSAKPVLGLYQCLSELGTSIGLDQIGSDR